MSNAEMLAVCEISYQQTQNVKHELTAVSMPSVTIQLHQLYMKFHINKPKT
jgi:hypothetical protein